MHPNLSPILAAALVVALAVNAYLHRQTLTFADILEKKTITKNVNKIALNFVKLAR
jgi:hypothetical protein